MRTRLAGYLVLPAVAFFLAAGIASAQDRSGGAGGDRKSTRLNSSHRT